MPIWFNSLLSQAGIEPGDVRLLRHETTSYKGRTPYGVWRDDRAGFERWQSTQDKSARSYFRGRYWAAFVVPPNGKTLFAGLYAARLGDSLPEGWRHLLADNVLDPDLVDLYECSLAAELGEFIGRLYVDWGPGTRSWRQIAKQQNKPVVELSRSFSEPPFPGFSRFIARLSDVESFPAGWADALASTRGVYLLTCPRTKEQYVGAATGADGFLGRWRSYCGGRHGGNVGLRSREQSDYQISILETASTAATADDILAAEALWKAKLQSREIGLNRN